MLALRDPAAQRWLEEAVTRLLSGQEMQTTVATFRNYTKVFRISATRALDYGGPDFALLVHPRPHILVVIRSLTGGTLQLDAEALQLAFGLSGAETNLCQLLVNGYSLIETARLLHISEGTVRQRAKAVFQKTGTHRQGELIALVSHFAVNH